MVEGKQFIDKRERKKGRKEGRRKERGVGIHSNKVGSFPTRDILGIGAIQWPWSLVLTWGLVQKQFECKLCTFSRHFDARKGFLVQVELAGKYYG